MKHRIRWLLAWFSYYVGVDRLFYWLNRNAKRIITFHNVLPSVLFKKDLTNGVSDSEDSFRFIVREIKKSFDFSVDLSSSRTATLTFDDGFLNQYEVAGQILREEGDIPAIVFVAGDVLGNTEPGQTIIVERLLHWTAYAPNGSYDFPFCGIHKIMLTDTNRGAVWVKYIRPAFAANSNARGYDVFSSLDLQYPFARVLSNLPEEYRRLRLTGITESQLDELRARGWKIGWHTKSHFPLSSLDKESKCKEIMPPEGFEDIVFSYPYGETLSVDSDSIRIAEDCGYPCAVSNLVDTRPFCCRYFKPRMSLSADRYLLHFKLSGAEHFLRTRRLLDVV